MIEQKGLLKKCQVLAKAVARRSKALKNLQEAVESWDTILTSVDVTARKVEIEQTTQMLQEAQKAHNKATSEVQNKMIIMGHQILSCHVPVVRSFFIL